MLSPYKMTNYTQHQQSETDERWSRHLFEKTRCNCTASEDMEPMTNFAQLNTTLTRLHDQHPVVAARRLRTIKQFHETQGISVPNLKAEFPRMTSQVMTSHVVGSRRPGSLQMTCVIVTPRRVMTSSSDQPADRQQNSILPPDGIAQPSWGASWRAGQIRGPLYTVCSWWVLRPHGAVCSAPAGLWSFRRSSKQ